MAHHRKAVWQLEAGYTCAVDTDARARGALQRGGVHIRTLWEPTIWMLQKVRFLPVALNGNESDASMIGVIRAARHRGVVIGERHG
jgi:hypothetical protein